MKRIKVAQIGTSRYSHGTSVWKRLNRHSDMFDTVGYALPENERQKFPEQMEFFDGYREMTVEEILNDPEIEAVVVETEEIYLTKYALMVAKAGKHLHMEKPGGVELNDFEELIRILKEKNLAFTTGYMYRFNPEVKKALDRVERGELGKIYSVEAHMSCKQSKGLRQYLDAFPHGNMFFLGCHLIDLIYRIKGAPTEIVPFSCATGIDGIDTVDLGMVVLKYPDGVAFAKTSSNERGGFLRRQLVICGEKGTIEIKPLEVLCDKLQYTVCSENSGEGVREPWTSTQTELYDRYDAMIRNFGEIVRGKENPYSYDYELELYKLVLRACGRTSTILGLF